MLSGFLNWGWGLCRPHFTKNHIQSKVLVSELFMDLRLQNRVFRVFRKNSLCASRPDDLWMKDNMVLNVSLELGHLLKIWSLIYGPKGPKWLQGQVFRLFMFICMFVVLFLMLIFYYLNHTSYFFVLKFCSFPSVREVLEVPSASFWWKPHAFKSSRFRVIQWTKGPKIIFFRIYLNSKELRIVI